MIVRDEEANLPDCVAAAAPLVDEWIVYDTGSTDRTREVATELGCTVIAGEWRDDFAWARNQSLQHATGDWIVVLDADDRLERAERLRALVASDPPVDVLELMVECPTADGSRERVWQPRVFRRAAGVRYSGVVHEWAETNDLTLARTEAGVVLHEGYRDPTVHRRKAERNLRLLASLPDDDPARWHHTARTLSTLQRWPDLLAALDQLGQLGFQLGPDLLLARCSALTALGRHAEAVATVEPALHAAPDHPDPWFGAVVASLLGWLHACRAARSDVTQVEGAVRTVDLARPISEALVAAGLFKPELLASTLGGAE